MIVTVLRVSVFSTSNNSSSEILLSTFAFRSRRTWISLFSAGFEAHVLGYWVNIFSYALCRDSLSLSDSSPQLDSKQQSLLVADLFSNQQNLILQTNKQILVQHLHVPAWARNYLKPNNKKCNLIAYQFIFFLAAIKLLITSSRFQGFILLFSSVCTLKLNMPKTFTFPTLNTLFIVKKIRIFRGK